MAFKVFIAALASVAFVSGCVDPGPQPASSAGENSVGTPQLKEREPEPHMKRDKSPAGGMIELPVSMYAPAVADVATRLHVRESDIRVLRATSVTWRDGSIGCPQPDTAYTQAFVPGFWVVLEHAGKLYSYHAVRNSTLQLCEKALPDPTGAPPHGQLNEDV